jgi:hypothetical protein
LAGEKGFGFLADVVLELDKRGITFKLVVVGGNRNSVVEQEVKDYFRPLVEKDKVVFTGFKVGEDLMAHYASADIFLHCSITETFGLVVLEAMASGVPVIARDEGGPSDIVDHGTSGYLVPPHDLDGFVEKVIRLSSDAGLRDQFREVGLAHAREATWEKISNKVAWKMVDTIQQRESEEANDQRMATNIIKTGTPLYTWLLMSSTLRRLITYRLVDAKLVWGLFIILGFWAGVSVYLIFAKVAHLIKARAPKIHNAVKSSFWT